MNTFINVHFEVASFVLSSMLVKSMCKLLTYAGAFCFVLLFKAWARLLPAVVFLCPWMPTVVYPYALATKFWTRFFDLLADSCVDFCRVGRLAWLLLAAPLPLVWMIDFEFACPTRESYFTCMAVLALGSAIAEAVMSLVWRGTVIISPNGIFLESTNTRLLLWALFLNYYMLCDPTKLCIDVILWL